jgi:hypothetical protein
MSVTNTLAYFSVASVTKRSFITFTLGVDIINFFHFSKNKLESLSLQSLA